MVKKALLLGLPVGIVSLGLYFHFSMWGRFASVEALTETSYRLVCAEVSRSGREWEAPWEDCEKDGLFPYGIGGPDFYDRCPVIEGSTEGRCELPSVILRMMLARQEGRPLVEEEIYREPYHPHYQAPE